MKKSIVLSLLAVLAACAPADPKTNIHSMQDGGVDVGNLQTAPVPETQVLLNHTKTWSASVRGRAVVIENASGSFIRAQQSEMRELVSPDASSLQRHLNDKYPERNYKIVHINGFAGVRADIFESAGRKRSELFLVSELKEFIHIESDLRDTQDGIGEGDGIILTVHLKYKGHPYRPANVTKTVTLPHAQHPGGKPTVFSFLEDCFVDDEQNEECSNGVGVVFEDNLTIGMSGADTGRIIELGTESETPFDNIRVEGKYLTAPQARVPIADIYTVFTPQAPRADQSEMALREGYVYLLRTMNWPHEDLITKFRVDRLVEGKFVEISYQKLVYVKRSELEKQVELMNRNTLKYETPRTEGEVTLYNRNVWQNYEHSVFNFQYSTSGNVHITGNSWHLMFSGDGRFGLDFHVPHAGPEIGQVVDLGTKDLRQVEISDFPNPNDYDPNNRAEVIKGHTYAVYSYVYGDSDGLIIRGAVQVLDVGPDGTWVRLKFRRITVARAEHFQDWIELPYPSDTQSVTLDLSEAQRSLNYYPFVDARADQGHDYFDYFRFDDLAGLLSTDGTPFRGERGFYRLNKKQPFDKVTLADVEGLRGKFKSIIELRRGDVIAARFENFYNRTVLVLRVDRFIPGKSVKLSLRNLARSKTRYYEKH